jgi:hypothetical protein
MVNLPVVFSDLVRVSQGIDRYPYRISAQNLDSNFVYAALDADPSYIEEVSGQGGHRSRNLKFPAIPSAGTHVLGAVNGVLTWIATEDCP